jgi:hypothetical protein
VRVGTVTIESRSADVIACIRRSGEVEYWRAEHQQEPLENYASIQFFLPFPTGTDTTDGAVFVCRQQSSLVIYFMLRQEYLLLFKQVDGISLGRLATACHWYAQQKPAIVARGQWKGSDPRALGDRATLGRSRDTAPYNEALLRTAAATSNVLTSSSATKNRLSLKRKGSWSSGTGK